MSSAPLPGASGARVPTWALMLAFVLALSIPPLWAYSLTPSPTMLHQIWAVAAWGACLALAWGAAVDRALWRETASLSAAVGLLMLAIAGSHVLGHLPLSLALPPLLSLAAAGFLMLDGARTGATAPAADTGASATASAPARARQPFEPFAVGLAVAGTLSGVVAVIQVFFPRLIDGEVVGALVARSGLVGRAVGNLRQPNHLASVLLWGLIGLVPLAEWRPRWRPLLLACGVLMTLAVLLSASRTGQLGLALLFAWGLVDGVLAWRDGRAGVDRAADPHRRFAWSTRVALLAVPLVAAAMWVALDQWAADTHHVFGAQARLSAHDLSSSRFGIWHNTLAMIAQQPWTGVGWGEFNFAWTLTPFPSRPIEFFDHTHNLALQLVVELGIPFGGLVGLLLLAALWQAGRRTWRVRGPSGVGARAAFAVTFMILVHSLLEYPLWYLYFLLPAAWAWGFALGSGRVAAAGADAAPAASPRPLRDRWSAPVGLAMIVVALLATLDYLRVSAIYAPSDDDTRSLETRIAIGQRSPLFAHHADYADATSLEPPSNARGAFDRATHSLLDTRLMIAWSKALAAQGDVDRARYIAQRLKEFGKDQSDGFFDACTDPAVSPKPYQCLPPSGSYTWRDFVR